MSAAISLHYDDEELARLLRHGESELVERKETFQGETPTSVREAVCAFANDLPDHRRAGCIFIGVHDNGVPAGLAITDELLRRLADMKTDGSIIPPPTMTVEKRRSGAGHRGCRCLRGTVRYATRQLQRANLDSRWAASSHCLRTR